MQPRSLFHWLIDEVDLVTVALDLGDEWLPCIGFEAFLKAQPEMDPRWQRLLRWLCDKDSAQRTSASLCCNSRALPYRVRQVRAGRPHGWWQRRWRRPIPCPSSGENFPI